MAFIMKVLALAMFAPAAVFTQAVSDPGESPSGYSTQVLEWDVQAFPGGPYITLNGTLERVYHQLVQINPNYDTDFPESENEVHSIGILTDFSGARYYCDSVDRVPVKVGDINNGISYLRRVSGKPRNGPGPGNCGKVSCSWGAAIWWCNDDTVPKELASFGSIADGAQYIIDRCTFHDSRGGTVAAGQVFHKTNWNVIVKGQAC